MVLVRAQYYIGRPLFLYYSVGFDQNLPLRIMLLLEILSSHNASLSHLAISSSRVHPCCLWLVGGEYHRMHQGQQFQMIHTQGIR